MKTQINRTIINRSAVINLKLRRRAAWKSLEKARHQSGTIFKRLLCEGVIDCFVLFTLFFLLLFCLSSHANRRSEIACQVKSSVLRPWKDARQQHERWWMQSRWRRRRRGEMKKRLIGREREKEEEWYGCADSLWPFSLLHQQHRGYLYIGVGCSAPLYKPLRTHARTHSCARTHTGSCPRWTPCFARIIDFLPLVFSSSVLFPCSSSRLPPVASASSLSLSPTLIRTFPPDRDCRKSKRQKQEQSALRSPRRFTHRARSARPRSRRKSDGNGPWDSQSVAVPVNLKTKRHPLSQIDG